MASSTAAPPWSDGGPWGLKGILPKDMLPDRSRSCEGEKASFADGGWYSFMIPMSIWKGDQHRYLVYNAGDCPSCLIESDFVEVDLTFLELGQVVE